MHKVQLFVTCLVDTFFPEIGESMVRVLQRAGAEVAFPEDQTCCGQPPFNAGLRAEAGRIAKSAIATFEATTGDIVMPSGSCAHMIRHNYTELFADDPEWLPRAQRLAGRTFEFTEYLVDMLGVTDCGGTWEGSLAYHPSCHLHRGLGIDRQPRALLAAVRGAELRELPEAEDCCGFGGIFAVEQPELSAEMLKRKVRNFERSESETLVVCEAGCLMHVQGGLKRKGKNGRVLHIAEVLDHVA